jgi:hypothetical protein
MDEQRPWHRLFGLSWMDFCRGLPLHVELEKDLSLKQQLLDLLVIRKEPGPLSVRLPDGFEDLGTYNLISFKSFQEVLDAWALLELLGHYVNYRKQVSPSMRELLPESEFRLFAVCVRFPQGLAQQVELTPVQPGAYDLQVLTVRIRLVVIHQLPQVEHNAMLHLFSARASQVEYGVEHYELRSEETSTLLYQLFERYRLEVTPMADALEEFAQQTIDELLKKLPAKRLLERLTSEERLEGLPAEERLKGLSVDEMLAALSPDLRREFARKLKGNGSDANPQQS